MNNNTNNAVNDNSQNGDKQENMNSGQNNSSTRNNNQEGDENHNMDWGSGNDKRNFSQNNQTQNRK